jgi:hypothetical protein
MQKEHTKQKKNKKKIRKKRVRISMNTINLCTSVIVFPSNLLPCCT